MLYFLSALSPELLLILINLLILCLGFFVIHPLLAGDNLKKLVISDAMSFVCALLVAGKIFWDTGVEFDLLLFNTSWFVFSLATYAVLEIPFIMSYFKKYKIDINQ